METSPKCRSPTALPREGLQVPLEIEAGWAPEPVWTCLATTVFDGDSNDGTSSS